MVVSSQLHAPANLPLGKVTLIPTGLVWTIAPAGMNTPDPRVCSPVTILTTLSLLLSLFYLVAT